MAFLKNLRASLRAANEAKLGVEFQVHNLQVEPLTPQKEHLIVRDSVAEQRNGTVGSQKDAHKNPGPFNYHDEAPADLDATLARQSAIASRFQDVQQQSVGADVFLSYHSVDRASALEIGQIIEQFGSRVYIDSHDTQLSSLDEESKSLRLKSAIKSCGKFVLVLSSDTARSAWLPWELGLADGLLGHFNVATFSIERDQPDDGLWYLRCYRKIMTMPTLDDTPLYGVANPLTFLLDYNLEGWLRARSEMPG